LRYVDLANLPDHALSVSAWARGATVRYEAVMPYLVHDLPPEAFTWMLAHNEEMEGAFFAVGADGEVLLVRDLPADGLSAQTARVAADGIAEAADEAYSALAALAGSSSGTP
jgi:hypothetical protein